MLRNDIRELFLEISQEKQSTTKLKLKEVNVFKKFMNEGKASIKFNGEKCNVFLSNCPPGCLIFFLKTMFIKLTKDSADSKGLSKEDMHKKLRTHLLSEKSSQFEEISPITNAEIDRAKKAAISKSSVTTPSPPMSKKRRLAEITSNENPKAAKKLYAPSPLSVKPVSRIQERTNPDDPALMETLNEEQNSILQGKTIKVQVNLIFIDLLFRMCTRTKRFLHRLSWNWKIFSVKENYFNSTAWWHRRDSFDGCCCVSNWWSHLAFLCWGRIWRSQSETFCWACFETSSCANLA